MARSKSIRAPTTASLPNTLRIPSTSPSIIKALSKLSRQSLLDLVFQWLDDTNVITDAFRPYLERDAVNNASDDDENTSPYAAEKTVDDVRNAYQDLQERKGGKREVIDRVLEGDWRQGVSLRQLAMVDVSYMEDHPASLRWTALELARIGVDEDRMKGMDLAACLPPIHASTFLKNLQGLIAPLVKAHYHLSRSKLLPLTYLRILVTSSPYQNPRQAAESLTDSAKVIYVAFPDSCPFIYTSISSTASRASTNASSAVGTDTKSLQAIVRDAIPKALSRPQERYTLNATALTAKNLQALLALRGPGRSNAANGAFSIFADAVVEGSPLDPRPSNTVSPEEYMNHPNKDTENSNNSKRTETDDTKPNNDEDNHASKKRKTAVSSRFGTSSSLSTAPLDRLDIRLLDSPRDNHPTHRPQQDQQHDEQEPSQPTITLTFTGTDVISGIRKLAELGVVDPLRMPSWMTGEEGVSVATVRGGKRVIKDDNSG